jgi:hypothetical protein
MNRKTEARKICEARVVADRPRQRRLGICTATVVLVNLLLGGCASIQTQDVSASGLVARLSAQADAWDKAIVRKDRAAIEQNMAEDFRQIDGAGNIESGRRSWTASCPPTCRSTRNPHVGQAPGDALQ